MRGVPLVFKHLRSLLMQNTEHFILREDAENDLLACAAYVAESIQSNEGRAEAMAAVVPALLGKGNVDLAAELANTLDDPYARDRLLCAIAEQCAATDDEKYALQLVEAMDEPAMQAQALEKIGTRLADLGKTDEARSVSDSLDHRDRVLAGIAVRHHQDGLEEAAAEALAEITFPSAAVHALLTIAAASIEKGDMTSAVKALDEAAAEAEQIEHEEERIRALIDVGNSFSAAERNDRAIETLDKAREYAERLDNVHRDGFLGQTSVGLLRAGSIELADRILDAVGDKTEMSSALLGFSREYWRKDDRGEAMDALEEANAILRSQADKETRDSRARFALMGSIAVQFAGFEQGERAIDLASDIEDEGRSMTALAQIANILTFQRNEELARTALAAIPEDAERAIALIHMSDTLASAGETERAVGLLEEAFALAEEVPQLASRASAYAETARRFAQLDHGERSNDAFEKSLEVIAAIKDESTKVAALAELSGVAAELERSETDGDREWLKKIVMQTLQQSF